MLHWRRQRRLLNLTGETSKHEQQTTSSHVHVLFFNQHLDEALHRPNPWNRDFKRLSTTHWAVTALLMLERVGVYTFCADEHEVIVEVCR